MSQKDRNLYDTLISILTLAVVMLIGSRFNINTQLEELKIQYQDLVSDNQTLERRIEYESEQNLKTSIRLTELQLEYENISKQTYDYEYVVRVVSAECEAEPYDGKVAVAQTIKNRAEEWEMNPEQVVKAKNQYAKPASLNNVSNETWQICNNVFYRGLKVTEEPIKWFYAPALCRSVEHENREFVMEIGGHRFYK